MLPQKETRFSWYFNSNGFFKIVRDACEVYIHQVAGIDTMLLVLAGASRVIQWRLTAVSCREARRIYCHFRTAVCVLPNSLTYSVSLGYSSSLIYRRSRPSRWFHCVLTVPVSRHQFLLHRFRGPAVSRLRTRSVRVPHLIHSSSWEQSEQTERVAIGPLRAAKRAGETWRRKRTLSE